MTIHDENTYTLKSINLNVSTFLNNGIQLPKTHSYLLFLLVPFL